MQHSSAKIIRRDDFFSLNSEKIPVKQNRKYKVNATISAKKGIPFSTYFCVLVLDQNEREIIRYIKWITNFNDKLIDYTIIFATPANAENVILGYRINTETPVKSDIEIQIPSVSSLNIQEVDSSEDEHFDKIDEYRVPPLPPLSRDEEDVLEKKMCWVFCAPRSGSTWLGDRLLRHADNIIWFEPLIGYHLGMKNKVPLLQSGEGRLERVYDVQSKNGLYFFSPHHKNNWLPLLRKLILFRTYSHTQTLTKNVIIKEPVGAGGADIILESLPNSKLIFLVRDGRDVLDSRIDMHGEHTWAKLPPLKTQFRRIQAIKGYSHMWNTLNEGIQRAYENHNPELRLFVKYEDLKKNTLPELRRIYDFLQVSISDEELKKIIEYHNFKNIPNSQKGTGKFYRAGSTGGWRNNFSKEEQDLMNSIMGKTLTKMGYEI